MLHFDMRTLVTSFIVTNLIITIVMIIVWRQNRRHFEGSLYWAVNFIFQTLAITLIALRGFIPDWASMVLSNSLIIMGSFLGLIGLEKFAGIKGRHLHNYLVIAIFIFCQIWFSLINPDLSARNLNLSSAFLIMSIQICWLVAVKLKGELRIMTFSIGLVFFLYCLINVARIINFFTSSNLGNDYFSPNLFESFVLVSYQVLFMLLTYSLALMFNKRLLVDIDNGAASLKESQALLQAAMDFSPSGIAIADAPDGRLRYVNKAGLMIPAKTKEEIVEDVNINMYVSSWKIKHHDGTPYKPDEVPLARALLYGETISREFIISRNDNDDRVVLANAAPILDDKGKVKAGIIVFHDITDYKRAEELIRQQYFTLKGLNDSSKSPNFSVDTKYCYTSFNTTHSSVMKHIYNVDIELGMNLLQCMTNSDDRNKAKHNIDRALKGEYYSEESFSGEVGIARLYFEVTHNPIFNDNSEVIGVAVLARDLSTRKKLEIELNNKIAELEKFNKIMVGRELKMIELKQKINELCSKLKMPERYKAPEEIKNNGQ